SKEIVIQDFSKLEDDIFKKNEIVINFAAIVHNPSEKDELVYSSINFELPIFLAEKSKKNMGSQFIQISTISVYGEVDEINQHTPCIPTNHYGKYKLKADDALMKLSSNDFTVTCVRPSMVYGAKNCPGNLSSLINLVKKNIPLPFNGIDNKRQFLNVYNLAHALKAIIEKQLDGIILIADEEKVSTSFLVNSIYEIQGSRNKNFKFSIFWKLVGFLKPDIVRKLCSNLIIHNTYSLQQLGIKKPKTIVEGLREMLGVT
ncbi:MAG: NAD-dependent epimerase/dehydratase family protein, partial [Flavobacteriaceae bacterium]